MFTSLLGYYGESIKNVIDFSYCSGKRGISINFYFSVAFPSNISYFLVNFAIQSTILILICVFSTLLYVLAVLPVIICFVIVDSYRFQ